jgi:hypothetical protein
MAISIKRDHNTSQRVTQRDIRQHERYIAVLCRDIASASTSSPEKVGWESARGLAQSKTLRVR